MTRFLRGLIFALLTMHVPFAVEAAEDFTLWDDVTFNGPFADPVIANSGEISNNNSLNSIKVSITYHDIEPNICSCGVFAVIQEEISPGVWIPLAPQNASYRTEGVAPERIITVGPHFVSNPGGDLIIVTATGNVRISDHDGVAPGKFRVQLVAESPENLTAVRVSAVGRKFDQ